MTSASTTACFPAAALSAALAAALILAGAPLHANAQASAQANAASAATSAAPPPRIAEHYTKYEFRIPMRDGVRLFTVVYQPKDDSRRHPILMERTPYAVGAAGRERRDYGVDFFDSRLGPSDDFARAGYIFVRQDVRGRFLSEGRWLEMQPHNPAKQGPADTDASTDTFDTLEWLLKHLPNHNGRVGIWGNSYPGFYAAAGIIDGHPAIKAASPQAPVTDMYMNDDAYHNGAFMLAANYGFYSFFKPQANPTTQPERYERFDYGGATSGYDHLLKLGTLKAIADSLPADAQPFFREMLAHPTRDAYWRARDISAQLKNVRAAVLTVGGWYDAEDPQGPLSTFAAIDRFNPGAINHLVMGPWVHGGWLQRPGQRIGDVDFDAATAADYRRQILFPFFERHLRGQETGSVAASASTPSLAKATVFETGTNVWRRHERWPPAGAQPRMLFLQPGGGLGFTPPPATPAGAVAYDEFVSDPARPVPFVPYAVQGVPQAYVVGDQRFAAARPDVLVYQTAPLEEDLTVMGPLSPHLFVSTSGTDGDWIVKLIDVWPDRYPEPAAAEAYGGRDKDVAVPAAPLGGYQQLVRGEPMRGKYRQGFDKPVPFVPGEVATLDFHMPDIAHTFRRGHRIMVQVQGSWFPLIDRNPQTFVNIPDAEAGDFRAATQRVFRSAAQASGIGLLVMPSP